MEKKQTQTETGHEIINKLSVLYEKETYSQH